MDHHPPDVIRVGKHQKTFSFLESRITTLECDLLRNQTQLDHKQAAYQTLISQLKHNAEGFTAMATLVNHLSNVALVSTINVFFRLHALQLLWSFRRLQKTDGDETRDKEHNQRLEKLYECIQQKDAEIGED